jgi:hypothetical protein
MADNPMKTPYELLSGDDDARICADIPDAACRHRPRNFLTHVAALTATKTADALVDPRLILAWLMIQVGAPAALVGLLVPIREAGALLPQLFTAGYIRLMPKRKWAWSIAAAVQGLAALGIAAAALTLYGATAGWAILGCLAMLAVARSVASVSHKDVLGKTVERTRRGAATGAAASLAAVLVIAFALILVFELGPRGAVVLWALMVAGGLWLVAAALFATLAEERGATDGGANAFTAAWNTGTTSAPTPRSAASSSRARCSSRPRLPRPIWSRSSPPRRAAGSRCWARWSSPRPWRASRAPTSGAASPMSRAAACSRPPGPRPRSPSFSPCSPTSPASSTRRWCCRRSCSA